MALYLITRAFWITCFAIVSYTLPIADKNDAALYLQNFGYLEESMGGRRPSSGQEISSAIKDFQRFAGLTETGELNNETITMMNVPRCGVKDKIKRSARKKRYTFEGSKWGYNELTYRISKYSTKNTDKTRIRNELSRAFEIWSDVTSLKFKEKSEGRVLLDIRFEVGDHGDGNSFDGPGLTLAHAFSPRNGGAAHFDDEETWTIDERFGTNLFQAAAHEFGHSLGLLHSDKKNALMAPFYNGYLPEFTLHFDDIEGIQRLYGSPPDDKDDEVTGPLPDTRNAPDLCRDATIDAITRTKSGSTYVFKGNFYWKTLPSGKIAPGFPRKIFDDWGGLEGNLNASVTLPTGKTYFFKGRNYWRFTNKKMDSGYPKLISVGFPGIPDNLDAALVWSGNAGLYFFKGNKYWRFDRDSDPPVSTFYPLPMSEWSPVLADGIDAAVRWDNNRTYFFKGDQYYRYNDEKFEIDEDPRYPLSTAVEWFGCR